MRSSKYRVVATTWDHNGTLFVEVITPMFRTPATDAGARRAARRALSGCKQTHIQRVEHVDGVLKYFVYASRLGLI